jgi:hypothetical protein
MFFEKSAGGVNRPAGQEGYREKFLAAMQVRDIPPQASDELPE